MATVLFSLLASIGGGAEEDSRKALNKVCTKPTHSRSSFFGADFSIFAYATGANNSNSSGQANKHKDGRFFVASASELLLFVDDPQSSNGGRKINATGGQRNGRAGHTSVASPGSSSNSNSNNNTGMGYHRKPLHVTLAAIFVPPCLLEGVFQKHTSDTQSHAHGSSFWLDADTSRKVTADVLPRIHPCLAACSIRGIILTTIASEFGATAEVVLVDISHSNVSFQHLATTTNGKCMSEKPQFIIKMLPLSQVQFCSNEQIQRRFGETKRPCLPTCPVCLHRIDTARLGLPQPRNEDLCSKFCPFPGLSYAGERAYGGHSTDCRDFCPRQRILKRWPSPSRCTPCSVIEHYWHQPERESEYSNLFCAECAMHKTLWVCLTCGFVGCGRYTNKHSVAHFQQTGHPYSLELATLRIWDYEDGEAGGYAHRVDFLDCPSSPPLALPWMTSYDQSSAAAASAVTDTLSHAGIARMRAEQQYPGQYSYADVEKTPKKAVMIGQEYEALLQSALEDQAIYYEGEMAQLVADLSAAAAAKDIMTEDERREIERLKDDIGGLRGEIGQMSTTLLDAQAQEAQLRTESQRLLREQQVTNDVLSKLQEEARSETERGKMQMQELEQQVADLTANLRMRQQFSESAELNNAQIFGTVENTPSTNSRSSKRGKKKGRFARR